MVTFVLGGGAVVVKIRHLVTKPSGYMYRRRVPVDLTEHYPGKTYIDRWVGKVSPKEAARISAEFAEQDKDRWAALRAYPSTPEHVRTKVEQRIAAWLKQPRECGPDEDLPSDADHLGDLLDDFLLDEYGDAYYDVKMDGRFVDRQDEVLRTRLSKLDYETWRRVLSMRAGVKEPPLLSTVLKTYLDLKGPRFLAKSGRGTSRHLQAVFKAVGDRPLDAYSRVDANAVRDALLAMGLKTTSVRRGLNDIKAVFNSGRLEFDLQSVSNPFDGVKIPQEGEDIVPRVSFDQSELEAIARLCASLDDDRSRVLAILLETGARLGEIVGLRWEDMFLTASVPHIFIRPLLTSGKSVKTNSSVRKVPLVGLALQSAARLGPPGTEWVFPRYAAGTRVKSGSASASINAWLKKSISTTKTVHCLRHSMEDRLRAKQVAKDVQMAIVGHGSKDIHDRYGEGYPLDILRGHLESIALPALGSTSV